MHKIVYCILLAAAVLYSQTNNILILRPNESRYKKIEFGIKSAIRNQMTIRSIVPKNEPEILQTIAASTPKIVIAMDYKSITRWKKICEKNEVARQIPSIFLGSSLLNSNTDAPSNSCVLTYETKLEQYIDRVTNISGNKPRNIGVIYSSKSSPIALSYLEESSQFGINLHAKPVVVSDLENNIKSIVNNFINHYQVDFMIILDDHAVINNRNIPTLWVPLLSPLSIPVAIPSDFFYELEPRIGTFAIQPHYREIGHIIATVLQSAEANNWMLRHKTIYTDKSIFFFRNPDGSISKQEQVQHDMIASYHSETTASSVTQVAVNTEPSDSPAQKTQHELAVDKEPPKPEKKNPLPSPVAVTPAKKPVAKEQPFTIAAVNQSNPSVVRHEKRTAPGVRSTPASTPVKDRSRSVPKKDFVKTPSAPSPVLSVSDSVTQQPLHAAVADTDTFSIEITAMTTSIYKELTTELPVAGIGRSGDKLKAYTYDSIWYRVDFFGITGFLAKSDAKIVAPERDTITTWISHNLSIILSTMIIVFIVSLFVLLIRLLVIRRTHLNRIDFLLIAKKTKRIRYSVNDNRCISLIKYLTNFGFHLKMTKNLNQINHLLLLNLPDIICIDWKFESHIQDTIVELLRTHMLTADFILIFYNVMDPADITENGSFGDRTYYFNHDFTIAELNTVLPIVKTDSDTSLQLTGQASSSLEGKISDDTLTEILQLMDINKKTGCLLIENHHPVGMIFFESGIITHAITNSKVAEEAVFEILSMKHGRFHFLPGKKPVTQQMQLDIVAVLMEKAKLTDETTNS